MKMIYLLLNCSHYIFWYSFKTLLNASILSAYFYFFYAYSEKTGKFLKGTQAGDFFLPPILILVLFYSYLWLNIEILLKKLLIERVLRKINLFCVYCVYAEKGIFSKLVKNYCLFLNHIRFLNIS
jgi:hypothetical protein